MKALSILLLLWFTSLVGYANDAIDSLKQQLDQHALMDSIRVDILNELGFKYWISNPVQAVNYANQALELAQEIDYFKGAAYANRSVGVAEWVQGNYEEGLGYLKKSLVAYQSIGDSLNIANVMMNTGLIYSEQGSYEEALNFYQEALLTFEVLQKPERQINTINHIGKLYQGQEKYDRALTFYKRALTLSDSLKYTYGMATANLNLGSFYKDKGELNRALAYCNQALIFQNDNDDLHGQASTLYIIGTIYILKKDYMQAEEKLLNSLQKAVLVSSKKLRRDIYLNLKQVTSLRSQHQKALSYFEQYVILNDSLSNAENLRAYLRLEYKFDLAKKEQELLLLQKQAKLDNVLRNSLIVGILLILLMTYQIVSRQRLRMRKNKELILKNQEIYEANDALAKLKQKELTHQIEFKNKELTSYSLNFMHKNELMEEIKTTIKELKKSQNGEISKKLNSLEKLVMGSTHVDRDWQDFKRQFEEVHADFFKILKNNYPSITNSELKLSALLKLNMNLKEAAGVMGISPDSVKTARYRLRKKLGLSREENLVDYMIRLEKQPFNE